MIGMATPFQVSEFESFEFVSRFEIRASYFTYQSSLGMWPE